MKTEPIETERELTEEAQVLLQIVNVLRPLSQADRRRIIEAVAAFFGVQIR